MSVLDYCQRNLVELSAVELSAAMPGLGGTEGDRGAWLSLNILLEWSCAVRTRLTSISPSIRSVFSQ